MTSHSRYDDLIADIEAGETDSGAEETDWVSVAAVVSDNRARLSSVSYHVIDDALLAAVVNSQDATTT